MKSQKPLPQFGLKFASDESNNAAQAAINHREKLQSVYSTQCELHHIRLQDSAHKVHHHSTLETVTASTLFVHDSIHYSECVVGNKAIGLWMEDEGWCVLVKERGIVISKCENKYQIRLKRSTTSNSSLLTDVESKSICIYGIPIEETLYLMGRGNLLVFSSHDGTLIPIELFYEMFNEEDLTSDNTITMDFELYGLHRRPNLAEAFCYGAFRRVGMSLVRRIPPDRLKLTHRVAGNKVFRDIYCYFNSSKGEQIDIEEVSIQKEDSARLTLELPHISKTQIQPFVMSLNQSIDHRKMLSPLWFFSRQRKQDSAKTIQQRDSESNDLTSDRIAMLIDKVNHSKIPFYVLEAESSVRDKLIFDRNRLEIDDNSPIDFELFCLVDSSSLSSVIGCLSLTYINSDYYVCQHLNDSDCNR